MCERCRGTGWLKEFFPEAGIEVVNKCSCQVAEISAEIMR